MDALKSAEEHGWAGMANPVGQPTDVDQGHRPGSRDRLRDGRDGAPIRVVAEQARGDLQTLIYLDPRALTRDCVGRWLQGNLRGFRVCLLPDPDQIDAMPGGEIRAVIVNTASEPMSSASTVNLIARVKERLPGVPVVSKPYRDVDLIAALLAICGRIP